MGKWGSFFRHFTPKTIRKVVVASNRRRLPGLSAEMAYHAMLALFPTMLAILTAIGLFKPLQITFQNVSGRISEVAPEEALSLINSVAEQISLSQNSRLFSLSFIFALWSASGALTTAMAALDEIHQTPRKLKRPFWKARIIAIGLTIGAILMLMLAATLIFVSDIIVRMIANQSGIFSTQLLRFWWLLSFPLALATMAVLFAFVYRFGPSRWNSGQPIMPGAVLAAIFWAILSNGLRFAARYIGSNQIYGVVGAVIVLLLWLYMSSLTLLIGDQINVTIGSEIRQARANALKNLERT